MFDSLICWSAMTESVEAHCLECPVVVTFKTRPGYTTCKGWGRSSTDLVGPALSSRERAGDAWPRRERKKRSRAAVGTRT